MDPGHHLVVHYHVRINRLSIVRSYKPLFVSCAALFAGIGSSPFRSMASLHSEGRPFCGIFHAKLPAVSGVESHASGGWRDAMGHEMEHSFLPHDGFSGQP